MKLLIRIDPFVMAMINTLVFIMLSAVEAEELKGDKYPTWIRVTFFVKFILFFFAMIFTYLSTKGWTP